MSRARADARLHHDDHRPLIQRFHSSRSLQARESPGPFSFSGGIVMSAIREGNNRTRAARIAAAAIAAGVLMLGGRVTAAGQSTSAGAPTAVRPQTTVHYPATDAAKDIDAALAKARKDGRHVLLDFGADWCPDCRVLGGVFGQTDVAALLARNFHVVRIDVGRRDKNGELAAKYGATSSDWIPAIVVLAPDGSRVAVTDDRVRITRRTTAEALIALLLEWSPKARERELASFTERGVHVTIALDRDSRGGLWLAGTFTPTAPDTHLYAVTLPAAGIDGLGRPTRLSLSDHSPLRATGTVSVNRPIVFDRLEGLTTVLPIYPPGAVTLRVPVRRVPGRAARGEATVSYMACGAQGCLAPVIDRRVTFVLPD
jgi:thioredoxin 1